MGKSLSAAKSGRSKKKKGGSKDDDSGEKKGNSDMGSASSSDGTSSGASSSLPTGAEDVERLLAALQMAVTVLPPGAPRTAALSSACVYMQHAQQDFAQPPSVADALALRVPSGLPQALLNCRPPNRQRAPQAAPGGTNSVTADSSSLPMPPPLSAEIAEQLGAWTFDLFTVSAEDLPAVAFHAICAHPEVEALGITKPRLWPWIVALARRYHDRPFHNSASTRVQRAPCVRHPSRRCGRLALPRLPADGRVCVRLCLRQCATPWT